MRRFSFNRRGHRGNGANALRSSWLLCALGVLCGLAFATPATSADAYYAARRLVAATQSAYDADAQDYFDRAEALSAGCFDLTAISGTYTESYVKSAINTFVVTCKSDGTWSKLTEVYLIVGVQFGALTAKLKYDSVATLTNNGFVSGDYLAAGSGAGLTDGTSTDIDFNFGVSGVSAASGYGFSVYLTQNSSINFGHVIGADTGHRIITVSDGRVRWVESPINLYASAGVGFYGFSTKTGAQNLYKNGSLESSVAASITVPTNDWSGFAATGVPSDSGTRQNLVVAHDFLSATEHSDLTTAVETLMDALGCGVIP